MLTVIAIIGILAAILITAISTAMKNVRIATAKADVSKLTQAATAYSLDFGAFPPDCTAFWGNAQVPPDCPFPGVWSSQPPPWSNGAPPLAPYNTSLNPNELLVWYLTMQYSTGQFNPVTNTYPAIGYPAGWTFTLGPIPPYPQPPADQYGDWTPSNAITVLSHGVNAGPYFDLKAKQKTDLNANGYYEYMDPWGRPYMYRAYPQWAWVTGGVNGPGANQVTLTLGNLSGPAGYGSNPAFSVYNGYTYFGGYNFYTATNLSGTTGSIQLTGFGNPFFDGTFTFQGAAYNLGSNPNENQVIVTFSTAPPSITGVTLGQYSFPLHNKQSCDVYSLGPYGLTRAASSMLNANNAAQEWKPTHGGTAVAADIAAGLPSLDPTSLDAWPRIWGTPGDGNDINTTSGNVIVNIQFQDNICNWN